jgi:preprotein translocase subunit SecD
VTRRIALVLATVAGVWSLLGCSSVTIPAPCDLTMVALPADATMEPGEPLPAGSLVLAGPTDFDRTTIAVVNDDLGNPALNMTLRGDAIARVAAHTTNHPGEFMAVAINGTVVSVPMIQGPLLDGQLQITGASGDNDIAQRFAGCVP